MLLELNRPTGFNKTDLIHLISSRLKLRNYLELCTPTAGRRYGEIERLEKLLALETKGNITDSVLLLFMGGLPRLTVWGVV